VWFGFDLSAILIFRPFAWNARGNKGKTVVNVFFGKGRS